MNARTSNDIKAVNWKKIGNIIRKIHSTMNVENKLWKQKTIKGLYLHEEIK